MFINELYEKYLTEMKSRLGADVWSLDELRDKLGVGLHKMELDEGSARGVLYYFLYDEDDERQTCVIPVYGLCASSDRALTELFTRLSRELVEQKSTHFEVHCPAHDTQTQRVFSMLQFGYMAETGIVKDGVTVSPCRTPCTVRTLPKSEIEARWGEIWRMTEAILRHLQSAPVFYPCTEFTEELYRDFFLDGETSLHAAFDENGGMIGMIETNAEPCAVIAGARSANVGEVYVLPRYRGSGVADKLFGYAYQYERERGVKYLWVEHGTANPNARGFWGRYFDSFEYELDRFIEKI